MTMSFLYIAAGIFNTISLELLVVFFLMVFQVLPERLFGGHAKNVLRITVLLSFIAGLAGAYICHKADGHWELAQFYAVLFPTVFMPFLVLGFFSGNSEKKKSVTLYLKEGEYVIDSRVETVGTQILAANYAYAGDKTIRFMTHIPVKPVSIKAYCEKKDGIYYCTGFEVTDTEKKEERSKEERRELFHTAILVTAALLLPLPSMPMLLWYKESGVGENPYMGYMVWCLVVLVFGGCRKLLRSGHKAGVKIQYAIFNVMYYLMLIVGIVLILARIGEMIG